MEDEVTGTSLAHQTEWMVMLVPEIGRHRRRNRLGWEDDEVCFRYGKFEISAKYSGEDVQHVFGYVFIYF